MKPNCVTKRCLFDFQLLKIYCIYTLTNNLQRSHSNHDMNVDTGFYYAVGVADPGTGKECGFYFTKQELQNIVDSGYMIDKQVWLEHGDATREIIGNVVYVWVDSKHGMMVVLKFECGSIRSDVIFQWIRSGLFNGISLGYDASVRYESGAMVVFEKHIKELSIVRDPHHKTCLIDFVGHRLDDKNQMTNMNQNKLKRKYECGEQNISCQTQKWQKIKNYMTEKREDKQDKSLFPHF